MKMLQVGKTITKYLNTLTNDECDFLFEFTKQETDYPVEDVSKVPWKIGEKNNVLYYAEIKNKKVRKILYECKYGLADTISKNLGKNVYPYLTSLILWKAGQWMPRHVDNGEIPRYVGYEEDFVRDTFSMRYITSVSYLNDNYKGGYTYIRNDGRNDHLWRMHPRLLYPNNVFEDYLSKPEKGSTVVFYADHSNAHGVTKLENGERVILTTWFTLDLEHKETEIIMSG